MKILVTGGTGYVGAHIVKALLDDGHAVRMLVRRPEQAAASLGPLRVAVSDLFVGDATDATSVDRALDGCDGVVHAAAIFSLDARRADEMTRTNHRATELVVGGAVDRGLDPIVHISSTVALTRRGGGGPELPLGDVDHPYAASKRRSEEQVRAYQDAGAPVVSVYPGSVFGPHDPYLGMQAELLTWVMKGRVPMWPKGSLHYVDVREVAAVVGACMEPGKGSRRYVVPGHHLTGQEYFEVLRRLTGRRLPVAFASGRALAPVTRLTDRANRMLPRRIHIPTDSEGIELVSRETRFDTSLATRELGVESRPFEETMRDTLLWLVEAGHLKPKHIGKLRAD